jgi:signal transduction histidine kinase
LNWLLPIRTKHFLSTRHRDLWILIVSLAGFVVLAAVELFQEGLTLHMGIVFVLVLVLSMVTGTLIYHEHRCAALLQGLRRSIGEIAPVASGPRPAMALLAEPDALGVEIRTLTERWKEFCDQCRREHDTEMVQVEHLATMGELAAGVAHEIRNPLAGIAGAIEIITKDFPPDHPDREVLEDLRCEVRRIEKVLTDLLAYARPKPPHFKPASLKETVARTVQIARQQTGNKKVEFSIQIPSSLPAFRLDPEQLQQVLLNLVLNGIQAIEKEGVIGIAAVLNPSGAPNRPDVVEISVHDTGRGIPTENLERIFRPFYTTRHGGTGLGLSLCRRIVSQHGGTVSVESEVNQGSRFVVRLPLREVEEPKEVYVK